MVAIYSINAAKFNHAHDYELTRRQIPQVSTSLHPMISRITFNYMVIEVLTHH